MKQHGFTLAEILITLSIVGVIAALTMPTLVTGSRNQANASKLSATVSSLENAFAEIIGHDAVTDIYETEIWTDAGGSGSEIAKGLGNFIQCSLYSGKDFYSGQSVKQLDKSEGTTPGGTILMLKSGAAVFLSDITKEPSDDSAEVTASGSSLHSPAATVTIDVNGADVPNTYGRDIYFYKLGDNGHLYPYGGRDVSVTLTKDTSKGLWDTSGSSYSCLSGSNGMGCAARLAAENYRMNY